jgi:broad specificity phosphatase PhoE
VKRPGAESERGESLPLRQKNMSVKITYFVHGTTKDNEQGLSTGWMPGELSDLGVKQAKELGGLVSDEKFDFVFSSDLKRATDSAELGFGQKYKIISDKRLRECDYGDFTLKTEKLFKENLDEFITKKFPNGESYKDVEKRIRDFLVFLKKNYDGTSVAIVAHQAPQLALEVLLKNKTWEEAFTEDWRKTKAWKPGWKYSLT